MKLHNALTQDTLMKFGFRSVGLERYYYCKNIYKDIIFVKFIINLNASSDDYGIYYDVIDKNTQQTYFLFFNNVNGDNDLVVKHTKQNFEKIIVDMEQKHIIEERKR